MTHKLRTGGDRAYLRIATEEAFATREQIDVYPRMVRDYPYECVAEVRVHDLLDIADTTKKRPTPSAFARCDGNPPPYVRQTVFERAH